MLTAEQRDEFNRCGIVRMPGAIAKSAVEEMLATIWKNLRERYQIHREAPETWPEPGSRGVEQIGGDYRFMGTRHIPKTETFEQVGNAVVCRALDDLLGHGKWRRPERWGSLLVTFPESRGAWDVPSAAWHLDFPASRALSGMAGVRIFTCLAKLTAGGGGTVFVAGSHRLVQNLVREGESVPSAEARKRLIRAYPWVKALCSRDEKADRVRRFMSVGSKAEGVEMRVVEMTGEAGDVILAHPLMLHAPVANCSTMPRIVLSGTAFSAGVEPFKLYR